MLGSRVGMNAIPYFINSATIVSSGKMMSWKKHHRITIQSIAMDYVLTRRLDIEFTAYVLCVNDI